MKIPKQLKIGGHTIKVIVSEHYEDCGNEDEFANSNYHNNRIVIDSRLPQDWKESALIHEIFHCMNTVIDHTLLDSLAEQWYQVLKDNKLLK